ncbi:MAG TPA: metal-dependent hydrolase [Chitinophagaceae bacterium]|nr:metal-dependent hydrolase [Chitinophagaceae bacterium]
MDTLTHIVLGACIGELVAGKTIGKKAMLLGAVAQLIPDIDVVSHLWLDNVNSLIAHRGITHSLLFALLMATVLALISKKLSGLLSGVSFRKWFFLYSINISAHLFVDCLNTYGTGLFEPFSDQRISFHSIFVIDPFFSFWPFLAFIFLLCLRSGLPSRKIWAGTGLFLSLVYIVYAVANKWTVEKALRQNIESRHIIAQDYFITPTPMNSWLWFIAIKEREGYYTGYRSVFDRNSGIDFSYVRQNDFLLNNIRNKEEVSLLKKFSGEFYTVERQQDSLLVFNVLRFGQVTGWKDAKDKFAFYYYLDSTGNNDLVVQRGRFENWSKETFRAMLHRIKGN